MFRGICVLTENQPISFSRSQTKSIWLLVLSFIPLCGCLIAVVLGLVKGSGVDDKPLHLTLDIRLLPHFKQRFNSFRCFPCVGQLRNTTTHGPSGYSAQNKSIP